MVRDAAASAAFHEVRHRAALKSWETRRRALAEIPKPKVSRGDWANQNAEAERQLAVSPVAGIKPLGGGISETYKATLANGMKCNVKVSNSAESEVGVWEVAKLVGMDDMVPPAVIRDVDVPGVPHVPYDSVKGPGRTGRAPGVKRSSVALWKEGTPAADITDENTAFDGDEDMQRAAMFDYVTGNCDRHAGNWVVNAEGKIGLIDHNLAFSGFPASEFITQAQSRMPNASPAKFMAPYFAKKSQIADRLRKTGITDEQISDVMARIDKAASARSWLSLSL
jgi:hypothetical protein